MSDSVPGPHVHKYHTRMVSFLFAIDVCYCPGMDTIVPPTEVLIRSYPALPLFVLLDPCS